MYRITVFVFMAALLCLSVASAAEAQPRNNRGDAHPPQRSLPSSNRRIDHNGNTYFYSAGRFYRQHNGLYVYITAPLGAIVPALPGGYVTVGIGASSYFYNAGVYYRKAQAGYIVIEEPQEAKKVLASSGTEKLIVYPAAGQSDEQKSQDKYECYEWASAETGFDPTDSNSDSLLGADYQRAMSACLEAREYVVK